MIIAHLSDPHYGSINFHPRQFLSKRWLGNLNLLLFRQKRHLMEPLLELPPLFEKLKVDYAFITGDFTSTALESEFQKAKEFIDLFTLPTFLLPGNHDCYTRGSQRTRRFYNFFPPESREGILVQELKEDWWWIGLDCALPSPYFCSFGEFTKMQEENLEKTLALLPPQAKVVMGNHFPLFRSQGWRHDLHRKEKLQKILIKHPQVKLYLHGHDHRPYIKDKRAKGLPLVLNSGSISHQRHGGFYLIKIEDKRCELQHYFWRGDSEGWKEESSSSKILWETSFKI